MRTEVIGFERLKEDYRDCPDFNDTYSLLTSRCERTTDDFLVENGYLFKAQKLCIPQTSLCEYLVWNYMQEV
ncbi:hypothetical protein MA16_Dca005892 [Dendrobium catenatum]|uniref:Uncharacterized protein n=1 Tax=Dendrobium catenatum TaxID=906689 RepID=A0A2I0WXI1_9ASPA|nr:hypothetical protein MA16_Dca005892 [Dendrobium catenatum]